MKRSAASKGETRHEIILGCGTLAIAVMYYAFAIRIPESGISDIVGAQGLPKTYAVLLALLSIMLIARAVLAGRAGGVSEPAATSPAADVTMRVGWRTLGMLVTGAVYVAVVSWLGYLVSIAGLIAATVYLQGGELNRRTAAVAVGGAVILWLLFDQLLHIPHPAGIWPSLL